MNLPSHLSWENFQSTVLLHGQQRVHRVMNSPYIEVFGDGLENRIGVWLEVPQGTSLPLDLSKLTFITTRTHNRNGRELLEVATTTPSLHRQFYHFAVAVAERMILDKRPAAEAVALELLCFADLLDEKPLLGIERQLGLLGELLFLERLIKEMGLDALASWVGPVGEPHDFRVGTCEFEVKTTVATQRIHTIHGAEQLAPSKGCSLYLVSILLGPPGAGVGFSLADKVTHLSNHFESAPARMTQFVSALERYGFLDVEREHYTRNFVMRRDCALAYVDSVFPAITRSRIQATLGSMAQRVGSLQYEVNIEGLEHEDGTAEFEAVLRDVTAAH